MYGLTDRLKVTTLLTTNLQLSVTGSLLSSSHKEIIDKNNKDFYELKKKKDTLQEKRSTLMRDETASTSTLGKIIKEAQTSKLE